MTPLWSWLDFRHALCSLRRHPGFSAVAVLTLALGIGATTAIFGVVYGVLLKPLPYADAHELVSIRHTASGRAFSLAGSTLGSTDSMYLTYRDENRAFEHIAYLPARRAARLDPAETLRAD